MQVLQAGQHKLILLELDPELVTNIAKQAGFEVRLKESPRTIQPGVVLALPVLHRRAHRRGPANPYHDCQ